jgi:hypothetical protein
MHDLFLQIRVKVENVAMDLEHQCQVIGVLGWGGIKPGISG